MSHTETHGAPLSRPEKDAQIDTLERIIDAQKERITLLELGETAKYRRLDCVRVAQKYLEDTGVSDLIGMATNIARFVETGSDGSQAKNVPYTGSITKGSPSGYNG